MRQQLFKQTGRSMQRRILLGDRIEMDSRLGWANELDTEPDACARAWAFSKVGVGRQGSPGPSTAMGWKSWNLLGGGPRRGRHHGTRAPGQGQPSAQGHNCGFSKSVGSFFSAQGSQHSEAQPCRVGTGHGTRLVAMRSRAVLRLGGVRGGAQTTVRHTTERALRARGQIILK